MQRDLSVFTALRNFRSFVFSFFFILVIFFSYMIWQGKGCDLDFSSGLSRGVKQEKKGGDPFFWKADQNALFLRESKNFVAFSNLADEVAFLGTNERPDSMEDELKILLGLSNTWQTKAVYPGSKLYLYYEELPSGKSTIAFSKEKTPYWVRPFLVGPGSVRLEAALELPSSTAGELSIEKFDIILEKNEKKEEKSFFQSRVFQSLQNAKWWGTDRLFSIYGGSKYKKIKNLHRIEISTPQGRKIYFLKTGDQLIWKEDEWRQVKGKDTTKGFPLIEISNIYPNRLELNLWDESGFMKHAFSYTIEEKSQQAVSPNIFSKIKQRTEASVSLLMNNKRLILKQGDWVIQTEKGWRALQTYEEIEKALAYGFEGILFIFDGIEKKKNGIFFNGSLFNPMRTNCQNIRLPIQTTKKKA